MPNEEGSSKHREHSLRDTDVLTDVTMTEKIILNKKTIYKSGNANMNFKTD